MLSEGFLVFVIVIVVPESTDLEITVFCGVDPG